MNSKAQQMNSHKLLLEAYLKFFFRHQIQLKLLHFQTNSYAIHKATDSYLSGFADNMDKFMEVAQGVYGKLNIQQLKFEFDVVNNATIVDELQKFIKFMGELTSKFANEPALLAIRDEIVAEAQKLVYLLTFN